MLHTPPRGTRFDRVTDRGRSWPDVLSGAGAYFSFGGRYNRVLQHRTVYTSEDPLVSIAEAAFHQAVDWQTLIGGGPLSAQPPLPSPPLPLVSEHFLWCFTLRNAPQVVDVEDPVALHTFQHRAYELLNPSSEDYHRTAMMADLIRHHPDPQHPVAGGILAPSVRAPASPG
jgi:RES domain